MKSGDRYSAREDQIITSRTHRAARRLLPHRDPRAIRARKSKLARALRMGTPTVRGSMSASELSLVREHWPVMRTEKFIRLHLPGRSVDSVDGLARRKLGLRKKFCGATTDKVPLVGHMELLDQVRLRCKADGMTFRALDRELKTGRYFLYGFKNRSRRINLVYIARAVEFFGGTLVIDWNDRVRP